MSSGDKYTRKTKDWSGEALGAEKVATRIRRIKAVDRDRLVKLYLDGTKLQQLPSDIYVLDHLEVLWITGNKLTTLPDELSWLVRLENLRLDRNRFETLPKCVGRLPSLKHLGLNRNRLRELPEELALLTNLESLYLAENPRLPDHQNQDFRTKDETQAFLKTLVKVQPQPAVAAPPTPVPAAAAAAAVPASMAEQAVPGDSDDSGGLVSIMNDVDD